MRVELYRDGQTPQTPIGAGTLEQGETRNLSGYNVTFVREKQFSGFQVSKDPGNLVIWIASGLFMLGLFAVLYFPHRQVWARVVAAASGGSDVMVRTTSSRSFGVASDFEALAQELGTELASRESPVEAKEG
jgi:cytochrome c biogenesis protein